MFSIRTESTEAQKAQNVIKRYSLRRFLPHKKHKKYKKHKKRKASNKQFSFS